MAATASFHSLDLHLHAEWSLLLKRKIQARIYEFERKA